MPIFTGMQADGQVPPRRTAGRTGSPDGHHIRPESPPTARPRPMCCQREIANFRPLKSPSRYSSRENPRPADRETVVSIVNSMKIPGNGKKTAFSSVWLHRFTLLNLGGLILPKRLISLVGLKKTCGWVLHIRQKTVIFTDN